MSACFVLVIPVIEEGVQKFDTEAEVRRGDTSEIWGVQFEVLPWCIYGHDVRSFAFLVAPLVTRQFPLPQNSSKNLMISWS